MDEGRRGLRSTISSLVFEKNRARLRSWIVLIRFYFCFFCFSIIVLPFDVTHRSGERARSVQRVPRTVDENVPRGARLVFPWPAFVHSRDVDGNTIGFARVRSDIVAGGPRKRIGAAKETVIYPSPPLHPTTGLEPPCYPNYYYSLLLSFSLFVVSEDRSSSPNYSLDKFYERRTLRGRCVVIFIPLSSLKSLPSQTPCPSSRLTLVSLIERVSFPFLSLSLFLFPFSFFLNFRRSFPPFSLRC